MYEPSQTTTTRTGLQTRFQTQVRTRVNWKHMQTRAKLCHKIPPTFAGRRVLSDTAGQWPISSKQVSHVAEKRLFSTHSPWKQICCTHGRWVYPFSSMPDALKPLQLDFLHMVGWKGQTLDNPTPWMGFNLITLTSKNESQNVQKSALWSLFKRIFPNRPGPIGLTKCYSTGLVSGCKCWTTLTCITGNTGSNWKCHFWSVWHYVRK